MKDDGFSVKNLNSNADWIRPGLEGYDCKVVRVFFGGVSAGLGCCDLTKPPARSEGSNSGSITYLAKRGRCIV